jgi:hypothetical protein
VADPGNWEVEVIMRSPIVCLSLLFLSLGCKVVNPNTATAAFKELAQWKSQSEILGPTIDRKKYTEAMITVNAWIEAKKTDVTIAGSQWFSTVDLVSPGEDYAKMGNAVKDAFGDVAPALGLGEVIEGILKALIGAYSDSRTKQAQSANVQLDAYKWAPIRT